MYLKMMNTGHILHQLPFVINTDYLEINDTTKLIKDYIELKKVCLHRILWRHTFFKIRLINISFKAYVP